MWLKIDEAEQNHKMRLIPQIETNSTQDEHNLACVIHACVFIKGSEFCFHYYLC